MLSDATQNFFGWDSALVRTLLGLARSPADVVSEYVDGRRRRYVNPARFCLLSLGLWFLAIRLLGLDAMRLSGIEVQPGSAPSRANAVAAELQAFLTGNLELLLYLTLPLLALILRALFRGSQRNLAECLVLVLFLSGFRFLATAAVAPLEASTGFAINAARLVFGPVWLVRAAHGFFGTTWLGATWRIVLGLGLFMLATLCCFAAVALPWVLLRPGG